MRGRFCGEGESVPQVVSGRSRPDRVTATTLGNWEHVMLMGTVLYGTVEAYDDD